MMAAPAAPGGSGPGPTPGPVSSARGAAGPGQPTVVVWEWQDDSGCWRPYSGQVSGYIEQCLLQLRGTRSGGPASSSIPLGQADASLASYIIDIPSLKQFRQDTGKMRSVRRSLLPQSGALGSGVTWEWANDEGSWTPYETRTVVLLEHSYQARQPSVDLGQHGYNYMVDLATLAQVNKATGFRRQVRRQVSQPYPLAPLSAGSVIHSGPACSCHQCLANSSSGPMPSRSRHSFSVAQMSRPSLQGPGRASAANPMPAYSPYPRRPLSVGNPAWGGPWSPAASGGPSAAAASQPSTSNGLSIPSVPVQLNGPGSIGSALADSWAGRKEWADSRKRGMASMLMSAAGLRVRLTSAAQTQPPAPRAAKTHGTFRKAKKQPRTASVQTAEEAVRRYMEDVEQPPEEDCIICMERLSAASGYDGASDGQSLSPGAVGKFTRCGHCLHLLCMLAMYNTGTKDGSLQCPSCKTIYGEKTGTQPKGKMEIYRIPQSLPGHSDCGTIQIIYSIPPGIQGPEHPNPGQPYSCRGFPRLCFLPDSDKGRKVLELLKVAWTRRLIFTVGTSSTTGEPDTVVWNEIHHKTEMMSNVSGHGYPDPNYLDNVLSELSAQGVTEACLEQP
ncbi:putative E3 ubiquitin-protein ligase DTX2 isoform X2 [Amia ocellicauda]|uniref:putative E3 ubiquitin-protein ligase DTX2 isoform X2 n=1 Tax=Amia ocellicauda TaxID=2972642 RepID=UPI003463D889